MIVSVRHRLVILSMPKCATHSMIAALQDRADMVVRDPQGLKHCNFRKYTRHVKRFLETASREPMETACLYREPVDWLNSWWRYRRRRQLNGHPNSTADMSFADFVTRHLDDVAPGNSIGRPSRFVADAEGGVGVDHLFRYDRIDRMVGWVQDRTGWEIQLDRLNVSPEVPEHPLPADLLARVHREMAQDFEIYAGIG